MSIDKDTDMKLLHAILNQAVGEHGSEWAKIETFIWKRVGELPEAERGRLLRTLESVAKMDCCGERQKSFEARISRKAGSYKM